VHVTFAKLDIFKTLDNIGEATLHAWAAPAFCLGGSQRGVTPHFFKFDMGAARGRAIAQGEGQLPPAPSPLAPPMPT